MSKERNNIPLKESDIRKSREPENGIAADRGRCSRFVLACPVCGSELIPGKAEVFCKNNHHFDRAKQGYLNLLQTRSGSGHRHGDDRLMVQERTAFLEKGYYDPLAQAVAQEVLDTFPERGVLLDSGCGEGYYTAFVADQLKKGGKQAEIFCLDISKEAAKVMAKKAFPHETVVASAYALPVRENSCDQILCLFSPVAGEEFRRVLRPGGILIRVLPNERHLYQLKEAVYDHPYENPPVNPELEGFTQLKRRTVAYSVTLKSPEEIGSLFHMTPYYYKTSRSDQEKLSARKELTTELSFEVLVSKKAEST